MKSSIHVEFNGLENLISRFGKMAEAKAAKSAVTKATALVQASAKALCSSPGKFGTGELRNSIRMGVEERKGEVVGRVYTASDHAAYVEFGTGVVGQASAHPVAVKKGFSYANYGWKYTPDNGKHFYWTKGVKARPYMWPALHNNLSRVLQLISAGVSGDV